MTLVSILSQIESKHEYIDFVIVDNAPETVHGDKCRGLAKQFPNCRYIGLEGMRSPFLSKEMCIRAAQTEYVLVIDSHVIFQKDAILKLLSFCDSGIQTNDLYHGPICFDNFGIMATHMSPAFGNNFGSWGRMLGHDKRTLDPTDYYMLPAHGMGCFFVRRDSWLGFNPAFMGFGSEEGYIHEKYRLNGRNVWSMPFLKWWHNFTDKMGTSECDTTWECKYRNGLIAWLEVGLPIEQIDQAYGRYIKAYQASLIKQDVLSLGIKPIPKPEGYIPFLGYPIRILDDKNPHLRDYSEFENPVFYKDVLNSNNRSTKLANLVSQQ